MAAVSLATQSKAHPKENMHVWKTSAGCTLTSPTGY